MNYIDWWGLRTYIINGINNPNDRRGEEYAPEKIKAFADNLVSEGVIGVKVYGVYPGREVVENSVDEKLRSVTDSVVAIGESMGAGSNTRAAYDYVIEDLKKYPLKDEEKLNLIGYSGGSAVARNITDRLEHSYKVDNLIFIGSSNVLLRGDEPNNVKNIYNYYSEADKLSTSFLPWTKATTIKVYGVKINGEHSIISHTKYFDKNICELYKSVAARIK